MPQVHHVDVGAESDVIGEIPTVMIGVVIDDDVIAVPVPIAHIGNIHRCDAEVESPEPEAAGAASDQAPAMGMADAAGEAAVFPGMVEVKAGIVAAGIVADPLTVVMDVRRFGMALLIAECRVSFGRMCFGRMRFGRVVGLRRALHRAVRVRWPLARNVTATNHGPPPP